MTAPPKPWERKQTELSSAPVESIITPSQSTAPPTTPPGPPLPTAGTSQALGDMAATAGSATAATSGADGDAAGTTSSSIGRNTYGGGYGGMGGYGGYGGYGGMGGYGMGMGGYGMGMRGMYGGGMYGQTGQGGSTLEKAQMYIYQLCEIAQMVEFNAHGLIAFFQTMQKVSAAIAKYGREYSTKIALWIWNKLRSIRDWLVETVRVYFFAKDLTKEQLES